MTLCICYFVATILGSDYWGNILSPMIGITFFFIVFKAFFIEQNASRNRISGLCFSVSILFWAISDIMWAICYFFLNIDPEEVFLITFGYSLTNLFLALALTIYALRVLRKWNIVQIILDSAVASYFIIQLSWIVFFHEDMRNLMWIQSDWLSTASILLDMLIAIWVMIWLISLRKGKVPLYLELIAAASITYAITDLIYYYQYFYSIYDPNTLLDAFYVASFGLITLAALNRRKYSDSDWDSEPFNIGRRKQGYILFIAPVLLIIYKGFLVVHLFHFIIIILLYFLISTYIQSNIHNQGQLIKEKEQNSLLEQKVRERTEELQESNRELQRLIDQDYITELYNRRYLLKYLETAVGNLSKDDTVILLYIDINRFKMITTMFGNSIGEKILYEMASRLKVMQSLAESSILATYGDDTYIFAATGPYDYKDGRALAQKAIKLCSDTYQIDDYQIRVTVNIGVSLLPFDAMTKEDLIKHANVAMTQARGKGFNVIHEFDLGLSEKFFRKNTIELMLKRVDFDQEFMVYYQPQLLTKNKKIIGFEALLRWKTNNDEFISPVEFIPIAEETGSIIPIGEWVIKTVMKQLIQWNNRFEEKIMIGINVSLKQLNSAHFADRLMNYLEQLKVKAEWIDIEITESLQLQENPEVVKMLSDIRELGIKISIDDFGTGYSSLSYFKGLPADRIKLAKELVDFVHTDDFDYQLVKSIIQLSKAKGIRVIAEGVETLEQWETLKELECDEVQGFLFGRPMPVQEIERVFADELFGKLNKSVM